MIKLPLELQMMTIEMIHDYQTLVSLYDSLPLSADSLRQLLLQRIFSDLRCQRLQRRETLSQCRDAVHEMRDLLGLEGLVPKFQTILDDIESEVRLAEKPVEFRGLTHPEQGQTRLKKQYLQTHLLNSKVAVNSRRQKENSMTTMEMDLTADRSRSKEHRAAWLPPDTHFTIADFKDRLYREQLDEMWSG